MVAEPVLSVVIPSYNRRESLLRVLDALCGQSLPAEHFEVIVVLDGSTDGSADAVRDTSLPFDVRVVEQPNRGAGAARNAGAAVARGTYLLFIDDDILLSPRALAAHISVQQEMGGGCVLGNVVNEASHRGLPAALSDAWPPERLATGRGLWTDLFTGNLSLPRRTFAAVGPFDESMRRLEDMEYGFRCGLAGVAIRFDNRPRGTQNFLKTANECLEDRRLDGAATVVLHRRDPRIISMTTRRRPAGNGVIRPLILLVAASCPLPRRATAAVGSIPASWPGARALFAALNRHAYLRGVRSEASTWGEWRAFFNRSGGWRPENGAGPAS